MVAGPARAQSASDAAAARALFTEGVALADAEQWTEAIDRFERALALRDSAVISYNLGLALAHEGHPVEATERFRRVIRDEAADAELRASAEAGLAEAEPHIAWVTTRWDGATAGLELTLDGDPRPLALFGTSMPVDPGTHEIALRDGTFVAASGTVTVGAGERATLALTTHERPIEAPPPVPVDEEEPAPPPPDDPAPWIGLGVGVGVVVVAGAIVLAVVLAPVPEQRAFSGSLGTVEIGR